jgi:uncharacterized membrane protein
MGNIKLNDSWRIEQHIGQSTEDLTDTGVDDKFIKEVGENIEPGHSALFLLVADATPDKVLDGLTDFNPKVYQTSLSEEDEAKLRATFAEEE